MDRLTEEEEEEGEGFTNKYLLCMKVTEVKYLICTPFRYRKSSGVT
jgi:hypothetical protein